MNANQLTYVVAGMTCDHCTVAEAEEVTKVAVIDEAGYVAVAA